jgi:predicted DNA-binding protein with PD1-like motif
LAEIGRVVSGVFDDIETFVLILDQGEEAFKAITDFANQQSISGASVSAVGAFAEAKVGWFDLAAKTYRPIGVSEQCEARLSRAPRSAAVSGRFPKWNK